MNTNLSNSIIEFSKNEKKWAEEVKRIFRMVDSNDKAAAYLIRNFLESLQQDCKIRENFLEILLDRVRVGDFTEKDVPPYKRHDIY